MINLREIKRADLEAYMEALNTSTEESYKYVGGKNIFTQEQIHTYLEKITSDDTRVDWVMTLDEEIIGEVVLMNISDDDSGHLRLAIFDHKHFSKGYGSFAIKEMLRHGFDYLGLHRIELEVYAFNDRAIALYKKLGFTEEGRLRQAYKMDGYHDIILMSMLRNEF